jgi:uncharacterized membrane protein YwzB
MFNTILNQNSIKIVLHVMFVCDYKKLICMIL